ncbi:hypothetical protein UFOVP221_47 [uncultured Caudovirales phage]|uniref:Uncharacterized protein n=1 Tax=uncultured Caudovirales phage TaxID=2100421 RepID=A0A6J7WR65_9CAUD|nr:hypothetical protein UFOVP221_47 [uncultured Caudovirales phage]
MATRSPKFGGRAYYRQVDAGVHPPALFATPREIVDTHNLADMTFYPELKKKVRKGRNQPKAVKEELLESKRNDDVGQALSDSINTRGYVDKPTQNPYEAIVLGAQHYEDKNAGIKGPVLLGGHHRVAIMHEQDPDKFMFIQTAHNFKDALSVPIPTHVQQGLHHARASLNEIHALIQQAIPAQHHDALHQEVNNAHMHINDAEHAFGQYGAASLGRERLGYAQGRIDNLAQGFAPTGHIDSKLADLQDHLYNLQEASR